LRDPAAWYSVGVMRMRSWIWGGLLLAWCSATPAGIRANAVPTYIYCLEEDDPPDCLAREAVESGVRSRELLDAVLRHGLVDLVPDISPALVRGLDSLEPQLLYAGMSGAMRQPGRKSLLAAIGLVAAARHEAQPFDNPIYRRLARAADQDPRIPVLAMAIWVKYVRMNGWSDDFRVTHAGLAAIWERALGRRQLDAVMLGRIAGDLAILDELKPQAREFLLWYAQRPEELTTAQRIPMSGVLARYFDLPEEAASLLVNLGDSREWDMFGVWTDIAVARLTKGYDAASARHLVINVVGLTNITAPHLHDFDSVKRDALERAGARDELRELGAFYVRKAEGTDFLPAKSEYFAAASDYYLRAGDRERALESARRGLPSMPEAVRVYLGWVPGVDRHDPAAMANATQGDGTDAAIALYRAGAIDEALKTHYLTGWDRYLNAARAGEQKDPQWVIDYHWLSNIDFMVTEITRGNDQWLQQRAYQGLVRSCGKSLARCSAQTLRNIARLAASLGNEPGMREALAAALRQIDLKGRYAGEWVLNIAGAWAHCEEALLRTSP